MKFLTICQIFRDLPQCAEGAKPAMGRMSNVIAN